MSEIVYVVADHLVVLHDLVFQQALVHCERAGGRLRVATIDVTLASGQSPHHYLHDRQMRTALLSSACDSLASALQATGRIWNGGWMRVERLGDRMEVTCNGPDDALGCLLWVDDLYASPAFLDLVSRASDGFDARQEAVKARFGEKPSSFDEPTSTMTFGSSDRVRATLLGSYSKEMQSWLWSWANPSLRELDTSATRAMCDRLGTSGMRLFGSPGFACDEGFAWSVAMAAAHADGRPSLHLAATGPTLLFFALDL